MSLCRPTASVSYQCRPLSSVQLTSSPPGAPIVTTPIVGPVCANRQKSPVPKKIVFQRRPPSTVAWRLLLFSRQPFRSPTQSSPDAAWLSAAATARTPAALPRRPIARTRRECPKRQGAEQSPPLVSPSERRELRDGHTRARSVVRAVRVGRRRRRSGRRVGERALGLRRRDDRHRRGRRVAQRADRAG